MFFLEQALLEVSEQAAIAASYWRGKGDKNKIDQAATEAMRTLLNQYPISATVVIGEGEMDEAPMLYIGEKLGKGGIELDIAVDPLDGTTLASKNRENSISIIAAAEKGTLLNAPDMYMMKIGVGPKAKGSIDLSLSFTQNLKQIAEAMKKKPSELNIVILDRDRHKQYIEEAKKLNATVTLITDGDVSPMVATAIEESTIDVLFGIGGAPEGVLAACIAKCINGDFQGKLTPENEEQEKRCKEMGIQNVNKIFKLEELVRSQKVVVSLTGVTSGYLVKGVSFQNNKIYTDSLVLSSHTQTMRRIQGIFLEKEKK